jgi:hypothetical protein
VPILLLGDRVVLDINAYFTVLLSIGAEKTFNQSRILVNEHKIDESFYRKYNENIKTYSPINQ